MPVVKHTSINSKPFLSKNKRSYSKNSPASNPPQSKTKSKLRSQIDLLPIKPRERLLLLELAKFYNSSSKTVNIFPALKTIAYKLDISARHVSRLLKAVEQAGFLIVGDRHKASDKEVKGRGQTTNGYQFSPALWAYSPGEKTPTYEKALEEVKALKPRPSQLIRKGVKLKDVLHDSRGISIVPKWIRCKNVTPVYNNESVASVVEDHSVDLLRSSDALKKEDKHTLPKTLITTTTLTGKVQEKTFNSLSRPEQKGLIDRVLAKITPSLDRFEQNTGMTFKPSARKAFLQSGFWLGKIEYTRSGVESFIQGLECAVKVIDLNPDMRKSTTSLGRLYYWDAVIKTDLADKARTLKKIGRVISARSDEEMIAKAETMYKFETGDLMRWLFPKSAVPAEPRLGEIKHGYVYKGGDLSTRESWQELPKIGTIKGAYQYLGGDPCKSSNWESL